MISSLLMVKKGEIAFVAGLPRANGIISTLSKESLVTPYGLLIPFRTDSFMIIDYLETGIWAGELPVAGHSLCVAAIVTEDKTLVDFSISENGIQIRKQPMFGLDDIICRSSSFVSETHAQTALHISPTVTAAIDVLGSIGWKSHWFMKFSIKELTAWLGEIGCICPIPIIPCSKKAYSFPKSFMRQSNPILNPPEKD